MIGLRVLGVAVAAAIAIAQPGEVRADALKVLTAGAFRPVLLAVLPQFEASGGQVTWDADTVGGLAKRVEAGESFDVIIASPAILEALGKSGKIAGGGVGLAKVGVGVAVREGEPKPDISTVDGFKRALLAAKRVAYIDPAAGGSSGIYLSGLIDRLGIGNEVRSKSVLVHGGFSADRVASGDADLAIQQISELLPVKGVTVVGPLPADIQNYTIYAAGISSGTQRKPSAQGLIGLLQSQQGAAAIKSKGMDPIREISPNK